MRRLTFLLPLAVFCAVTCQQGTQIVEYAGKKYLKFPNPCKPDDAYCALDCSQQYHASETSPSGLCVECICKDGGSGLSSLNSTQRPTTFLTTPIPPTTAAHYSVVIQGGKIYLRLDNACPESDSLCSADCEVQLVQPENGTACAHCNCSHLTTPEVTPSPATDEITQPTTASIPTTTRSKEIVLINGIPHLLVDFPCTPKDNVCPLNDCIVDGVVKDVSSLCFRCECTQPSTPSIVSRPTTTHATTESTTPLAVSSGDTVMVGGVLNIVVADPCSTADNLCPVEGCSVDLQTTHNGEICFQCLCPSTTSMGTTEPLTTQPSVITTTEPNGLQTMVIGGVDYTILQNPCTPRDGLCPTKACKIEGHVSLQHSICFSCEC